jgi:hypothetical protein
MLGLLRLRWGQLLLLLLYNRYGFDLYHAALRNHTLQARTVCEMVTSPLDFGFAQGDDLVAVANFHEIFVCATAEDGKTDQECQSQSTLDSGRAHFRPMNQHALGESVKTRWRLPFAPAADSRSAAC